MSKEKALVEFVRQVVSEEVDAIIIKKSDKRRSEFQQQFSSTFTEKLDSLDIGSKPLKLEADAAPPGPQVAPVVPPAQANPQAAPAIPPAVTPPALPGAPATGGPVAAGSEVGIDPTGAPGAVTDPTVDADGDGVPDVAGGGGAGSGFGGFGGGGSGGGSGGDPAATPGAAEQPMAPGSEQGQDKPAEDPIASMVDSAKELLNQTQDPSLILKSLKGQIQAIFKEPGNALGAVKALYDTNDSVLQSAAQRLYLFLKSSQ